MPECSAPSLFFLLFFSFDDDEPVLRPWTCLEQRDPWTWLEQCANVESHDRDIFL